MLSSSSAALQPGVGFGLLYKVIPLLSISNQLLPVLHLEHLHIFEDYIDPLLCYIKKYKVNLTQNLNIHDYNMRRKSDFYVQICNTSLFMKSVINMGIKLYNNVPNRIKMDSFKVSKLELKYFQLDHSFYAMNTFLG